MHIVFKLVCIVMGFLVAFVVVAGSVMLITQSNWVSENIYLAFLIVGATLAWLGIFLVLLLFKRFDNLGGNEK